jgi:stress-induced morphogen
LKTFQVKKKVIKARFPHLYSFSGGCGTMFRIYVESSSFLGQSLIQQHRQVHDILKEDIKNMHGLQLTTKVTT